MFSWASLVFPHLRQKQLYKLQFSKACVNSKVCWFCVYEHLYSYTRSLITLIATYCLIAFRQNECSNDVFFQLYCNATRYLVPDFWHVPHYCMNISCTNKQHLSNSSDKLIWNPPDCVLCCCGSLNLPVSDFNTDLLQLNSWVLRLQFVTFKFNPSATLDEVLRW